MCGIVFAASRLPVSSFIRAAAACQHHRGPDDKGVILDRRGGVHLGFAHQRLSIVDLSKRGRQPMESRSGNSVIIFNGEIYNYRDLAREYGLRDLKTGTDTEIALELIEKIGIVESCRRFNGMWSIALWDKRSDKIFLTRDRFGKKPLNYLEMPEGIFVASEVKSFSCVEDFNPVIDPVVAGRFLGQGLQNIDERTWITGVHALPPATISVIDALRPELGVNHLEKYWQAPLPTSVSSGRGRQWISDLREVVTDAIKIRLHADVPVGVALSGGLDSSVISVITGAGDAGDNQDVKLFSAVHPGREDDESKFVNILARHAGLNVNRTSLDLEDGSEAYNLLAKCVYYNDGPLPSFAPVLFYKLMAVAKELGITVILTGQGADEALCGYRKYPIIEAKRRLGSGSVLSAVGFLSEFLIRGTLLPQLRWAEAKRYVGVTGLSLMGPSARVVFEKEGLAYPGRSIAERQLQDIRQYSVPYLCHYEDRMAMAVSREVRSPFLDYRVIELGLRMPTEWKMRRGWTKYALRSAFEDVLPAEIAWRKDKKGFSLPEAELLRGALRRHVEDLMGDPANPVYTQGLVDRKNYLDAFRRYCQGDRSIWFRDVFSPFSLSTWMQVSAGPYLAEPKAFAVA